MCGRHVHGEDCHTLLNCTIQEHTAHTAACVICGKEEHIHGTAGCNCNLQEHTHTTACWSNVGSQSNPSGAPARPQDGQIYRRGNYYIYISGAWYRYTGRGVSDGDIVDSNCRKTPHTHGTDCNCAKEVHTHTDSCYSDRLHTHSADCYSFSCGEDTHIHDADSCMRVVCAIPEGHSHGAACNSAGSSNTVKTIYAKYGQSLHDIWPVTDDNGKTYNSGERWDPSNSSYYYAVLVYIAQMPADDFTLTLTEANYRTFTMNYWLQVLPGEEGKEYSGKEYALDLTVKANYNYVTKAEDFFAIKGFVQRASSPAFDRNGQITSEAQEVTVDFYYDRVTTRLEFNNNGIALDDRAEHGIPYGAPLKDYEFTPPYPGNLEPNAYTFGGWYTSPGCFDGTEVDWDTLTMPEGNLLLYAKWVPITHRVRIFRDATLTQQIGETQIVDHKEFAIAPSGHITNGSYVFQGWFYQDEVNGVLEEKAFAFHGIPVVDDMDIYAKWSSHVSVDYRINYKLFNTGIDIADPLVGSSLAGHNKTFDAKAGDQLYADFRTGYYPLTNSHTITMSIDGVREFTFYYVYVESMPYKVQYINKETGQKLCEDKEVRDNDLTVVTETFRRFDKMMPDAYQKRLVLSADDTDSDGDGIYDSNVITFYYHTDEENAYYRVVHYIQNIAGDAYREYRSEETVAPIGSRADISALTLTGFAFNGSKTTVNGSVTPTDGTTVTATLGADGLLVELYYDRLIYDYTVLYVNGRTWEELAPSKSGSGVFGQQIVEYALDLSRLGYELVSADAKTHTISASAEHNIIEFHYQEKTVALKYQIVGPEGCGVLTQYGENLTAISGETTGSAPILADGFVFLGWFTDPECTIPVEESWVDRTTGAMIPRKQGSVWTAATYYAKFTALETDLTLTTRSTAAIDANQAFLFRIRGKAGTDTGEIDLTVTVVGNGSTTVTGLPTGDYTVTELTDWSWRYENDTAQREITLEYNNRANELIYDNSRQHDKWLDGNAVSDNRFQ